MPARKATFRLPNAKNTGKSTTGQINAINNTTSNIQNQVNSISNSTPVVGTVISFAGSASTLSGYLKCDESIYSISTYHNLFNVIGTMYGGDESLNFFRTKLFRCFSPRFRKSNT